MQEILPQDTTNAAKRNGYTPARPWASHCGLSAREHFAAQFMAAYISADTMNEPREDLASAAVRDADLLLIELAKDGAE